MKFNAEDKNKIQEIFVDKLNRFGPNDARGVFWINETTQLVRYKIFSEIGDLNKRRILDVGCGLGDFAGYLKTRFNDFDYEGFDVVPEMIEKAKIKYPQEKFKLTEIDDYLEQVFDYAFASGVFSIRLENYWEKYFSVIKKMYQITSKAVGFNMLSANYHKGDNLFVVYQPEEIKKTCEDFAQRVELKMGYLPQDFTIFLYH